MNRITKICSCLEKCNVFADVACDHGYCAEYMLKNSLCSSAVISDISDKSLSKARTLLAEYIKNGSCRSVCCDGLEKIDGADLVLIAGIGGEEIVKILKNAYIPKSFVFQPMKNADNLREYLLNSGCALTYDDIFTDGKNYYFIIKGNTCGNNEKYDKYMLAYGKDSLKNPVFYDYLSIELSKKKSYLKSKMTKENKLALENEITFMEGVLDNAVK